eukprot:3751512-Prorocentrum_lima.AAC.1
MWTPSAPCHGYRQAGARVGEGATLPPGTPLAGKRTRVLQKRIGTDISRFRLVRTRRNNAT